MAVSPYQTALALGRPTPAYVNSKMEQDVERLTAYGAYSDVYYNVPEAFAALLREEDDELSRRYVAAARAIVEASLRYTGRDLAWTAKDVNGELLEDDARFVVLDPIDKLFTREEFKVKFASVKRWMLVKGDGLLHITADPSKAQGTRIRITELAPETYFPKYDPVDEERVIGCYLVKQVYADDGTTVVTMRLSYDRVMTEEDAAATRLPIGSIRAGLGWYELAKWDDRYPLSDADLAEVDPPTRFNTPANALLMAGVALPGVITSIPVYHFRNNRSGTAAFGLSELQGIETILAGLTQTMSDEDIAIALQGIGMYWTDSGHPRDAAGNEVDWVISPASVAEVEKGGKFGRVEGANDVESLQKHFASLSEAAQQATGTPEVALGRVEVQAAESGVALAIQFAPITAKTDEKEDELLSKLAQFMYDLMNGWMPAYEGYNANGAVVTPSFGNKLPVNRKEEIDEIVTLKKEGIISTEYALTLLQQRLGFQIPADMLDQLLAEQQTMLDATGARIDAEANAAPAAG
jgi:hypothetical protein